MNRPPSIPQHIWDTLTDDARTAIGAVIEGFEHRLAEAERQIQELCARLDQNSTNSSRPPSTDPIGVKRKPPEPPSRRRRGGQEGHPRRMRALVPPERVASVSDCKPTECRRCGHPLSGQDTEPGATIFQVFSTTLETFHEPIFAPIDFTVDVDARTGRLHVRGVTDGHGEPIKNPVTGAQHRARIDLPRGFEYSIAEMGRGWTRAIGPIKFELADSHSHFARLHLTQSGVVH